MRVEQIQRNIMKCKLCLQSEYLSWFVGKKELEFGRVDHQRNRGPRANCCKKSFFPPNNVCICHECWSQSSSVPFNLTEQILEVIHVDL